MESRDSETCTEDAGESETGEVKGNVAEKWG